MKARYLFIGALILGITSIFGLRSNATTALKWRDQILSKDQAGADVTADIEQLQDFVAAHMNSSIKLELTASYDRAVVAAQSKVVSGEVYAQAQAACDRQGIGSVAQAQCVQSFLSQRLVNVADIELPLISQFTYNFAAPGWSPDLAGLTLLMGAILSIGGLVIYITSLVKNHEN